MALKLKFGGKERTYHLYRPSHLKRDRPVPLVVVLHGGFGSGTQAERAYRWNEAADRSGFVVAYPDGIGRAWNAGGTCCGRPAREDLDDVGFLSRLIQILSESEKIDRNRVFMTGMSNGAAMAYRYVCSGASPRVAAIGTISGAMSRSCSNPYPVSALEIHGLDDRNIPMGGGEGTKGVSGTEWIAVERGIEQLRAASGCGKGVISRKGKVTTHAATCPRGREVTLITIENAGHQWPGSHRVGFFRQMLGLDPVSDALDATSTVWKFFNDHPRTEQEESHG